MKFSIQCVQLTNHQKNHKIIKAKKPRLGTHYSLWVITTGRKTKAVISVDWRTWCQQSLLQKQKSSDLVQVWNPVSLEGPILLATPTQPWWVIWKSGPLKSSMDPFSNLRDLEDWRPPVMSPIFPCKLQVFSTVTRTQPHLNQPFPNCGSPPRPAGNETVNGTRQPCSSTVYGMHSTPPLGQHEEGGSATSLAMSTHQATIERQTPLLVWWSTKWFTICPFRLILTSMK